MLALTCFYCFALSCVCVRVCVRVFFPSYMADVGGVPEPSPAVSASRRRQCHGCHVGFHAKPSPLS